MMRLLIPLLLIFSACTQAQEPRLIGGPCEGCEAVLECQNSALRSVDTLPDFHHKGQRIKVTGTIFQSDGQTPAEGVILYVWHTNQEGLYAAGQGATGWAKHHGDIRGCLRTDENGRYTFYTLKPGEYPSRNSAAHIHPVFLESNGQYYYLGSFLFSGDELLTEKQKKSENPRGGSNGIMNMERQGNLWVGRRDFILGKNVPGHE